MSFSIQLLGCTEEGFEHALRKAIRKEFAALNLEREEPAGEIMKMMGWKTKKKFYKERQVRRVEPTRIIGATPVYLPSHFLRIKA